MQNIIDNLRKISLERFNEMSNIDDPVWKSQCALRAGVLSDVARAFEMEEECTKKAGLAQTDGSRNGETQ